MDLIEIMSWIEGTAETILQLIVICLIQVNPDVNIYHECVLILAEIELFFFLVVGTVLCFGFRIRIMLIIH